MFKYTLLLEMDTIYHIFTKLYDKKPNNLFQTKSVVL